VLLTGGDPFDRGRQLGPVEATDGDTRHLHVAHDPPRVKLQVDDPGDHDGQCQQRGRRQRANEHARHECTPPAPIRRVGGQEVGLGGGRFVDPGVTGHDSSSENPRDRHRRFSSGT
jgi:hypothetical protein